MEETKPGKLKDILIQSDYQAPAEVHLLYTTVDHDWLHIYQNIEYRDAFLAWDSV